MLTVLPVSGPEQKRIALGLGGGTLQFDVEHFARDIFADVRSKGRPAYNPSYPLVNLVAPLQEVCEVSKSRVCWRRKWSPCTSQRWNAIAERPFPIRPSRDAKWLSGMERSSVASTTNKWKHCGGIAGKASKRSQSSTSMFTRGARQSSAMWKVEPGGGGAGRIRGIMPCKANCPCTLRNAAARKPEPADRADHPQCVTGGVGCTEGPILGLRKVAAMPGSTVSIAGRLLSSSDLSAS